MCCTTCNQSQTNPSCPCCSEEPEEELIQCECGTKGSIEFFNETPDGLMCEECFKAYKHEISLDYNEYDE